MFADAHDTQESGPVPRNSLKSGEKAARLAYFARGSTDTDITVELDAEAVTDVPGNGIDAVSSIVNRHSILTPDRRAQLPPLRGTAEVVPVVNRGDPRGFVYRPRLTRSEAAWGVPVGPPGQPGRRGGRRRLRIGS